MSIALIDNSTISSVQRVLGDIEVKTKGTIDGDIAAFESFITSILFYNEQIIIDDYKEKFSEQRKKSFPFIKFVNPVDFDISSMHSKAKKEAEEISPTIQNGKFVDDAFQDFFELLKVNIKCTWDISSSIYYLTLKMLGERDSYSFDKYGSISHSIFNEMYELKSNGEKRNYTVDLLDGNGYPIKENYKIPGAKWADGSTGGLTSGLATFIASLNWIAYRSIYYTYLSEYFRAETFLHPIRQNFQIYYMDKCNRFDMHFTADLLSKFDQFTISEIEGIISSTKNYGVSIRMPFFLGHIISKTKNPKQIIEYAFELRNKKEFVQARSVFGVIRGMIDENGFSSKVYKETQKIFKSVQEGLNVIRRNYGVHTSQGDLASTTINSLNSLSSPFPVPQIPEFVKDTKISNLLSNLRSRKSFGFIYKDLSKDLLNISKLGKYHDDLTKCVLVNDDLPSHNPKNEDPKYMNYHSEWKSPMV